MGRKHRKENWLPIKGYEGLYMVSDMGNVMSLWYGREKILSQNTNTSGYKQVGLHKDGKTRNFLVHRLVAEAFIPNLFEDDGDEYQVDHIDENKENNRCENLRWCNVSENINFGTRNERMSETLKNGERKRVQKYSTDGELLAEYENVSVAAKKAGCSYNLIYDCCRGRLKTAKTFVWKFI